MGKREVNEFNASYGVKASVAEPTGESKDASRF